jgi:aspartate kinase
MVDASGSTIVMSLEVRSLTDSQTMVEAARALVAASGKRRRVVGVITASVEARQELIRLARAVSSTPEPRELDMLLTVSEQIACSLLAMAITKHGATAASLTGGQAGICTTNEHGGAEIIEIRPQRIEAALARGCIALVPGSQGVSPAGDITTLGARSLRGMAALLDAALCAGGRAAA